MSTPSIDGPTFGAVLPRWWTATPSEACNAAWERHREGWRRVFSAAPVGILWPDVEVAFRFGYAAAAAYGDCFWSDLLDRALGRDWMLLRTGQEWAVVRGHARLAWDIAHQRA